MRVVARDAAFEPENSCHSEVFAKNFCVVLFGKAGVPLLNFAQQAFLGGEQSAAAVDINTAAFEDDAPRFVLRLPELAPQLLIDFRNDGCVFLMIGILGPAVELKIVKSDLARFIADTD